MAYLLQPHIVPVKYGHNKDMNNYQISPSLQVWVFCHNIQVVLHKMQLSSIISGMVLQDIVTNYIINSNWKTITFVL